MGVAVVWDRESSSDARLVPSPPDCPASASVERAGAAVEVAGVEGVEDDAAAVVAGAAAWSVLSLLAMCFCSLLHQT